MSELSTSLGGDTDKRAATGWTQGSKLWATVNEPAKGLFETLNAASILSSDWSVPEVDGVAAAGGADARPRNSNAEGAVIEWCISAPYSTVSARVYAHPHGPAGGDCGPRKSV